MKERTTHTVDHGTGNGDTEPVLWKFDMHVHSTFSGDSLNSPSAIVSSFQRTGIIPLVCDHNTTAGSAVVFHRIREQSPEIPAISAEEIMTTEGEIIGLFLAEEVRPYLSATETVEIIHDQGGLALVPHPFCSFRASSALWRDTLSELVNRIDIIEGFNARTITEEENRAARVFAGHHGKPFSVGSDSHLPRDLGRYWLELEPFVTPEMLIKSLTADTVRFPGLFQ